MNQIPLMILGDAPEQQSGLARVARDLTTLIATMPEFRVATLGYGGLGCQRLPWQQYHMQPGEFGERSLPAAWEDFSEGARGVVLTTYDLHRVLWLARPEWIEDQQLRSWTQAMRQSEALKVWSYVPIDATGPQGRLTGMARDVLMGIDRVLAFTPWSLQQVAATIGVDEAARRNAQWLPHSCDTTVYTIRQNSATGSVKRVGCVMTNQTRKDWGTVAAMSRGLVDKLGADAVRFWWHSDVPERHWSLAALVADYELTEHVDVTCDTASDATIAERIAACDLTILPSSEGFGLTIFESLACGVPCLHGAYAGGASLLQSFGLEQMLIEPIAYRIEGVHNSLRPVFDAADWVEAAIDMLETPPDPAWLRARVSHLDMRLLGHRWKQWLREGVANAK